MTVPFVTDTFSAPRVLLVGAAGRGRRSDLKLWGPGNELRPSGGVGMRMTAARPRLVAPDLRVRPGRKKADKYIFYVRKLRRLRSRRRIQRESSARWHGSGRDRRGRRCRCVWTIPWRKTYYSEPTMSKRFLTPVLSLIDIFIDLGLDEAALQVIGVGGYITHGLINPTQRGSNNGDCADYLPCFLSSVARFLRESQRIVIVNYSSYGGSNVVWHSHDMKCGITFKADKSTLSKATHS